MSAAVIWVHHESGQFWIELPYQATFEQLYKALALKLDISNKEFPISFDNSRYFVGQSKELVSHYVPLQDGMRIYIKQSLIKIERNTNSAEQNNDQKNVQNQQTQQKQINVQRCTHRGHQKCLNCLDTKETKVSPNQQQKQQKNQQDCHHSKDSHCPLCQPETEEKYVEKDIKGKCEHAPHQKCINCLSVKSKNIKHVSFDEYIELNYHNCVNHTKEQKCTNCLVSLHDDFKIKKDCKDHDPYPKGMCSKCIPPLINIKRQDYWHVDYVQFMNQGEIQEVIQNWLKTFNQRVFYLYGYYAEDPVYYKGVWAIVEFIYEPQQENQFNETLLLRDYSQSSVDQIAQALGLERIGWAFTTMMSDVFLSNKEIIQGALEQQKHKVKHPIGVDVSKQLTLVLRADSKNPENVHPEVYMVSDNFQYLVSENLIKEGQERNMLSVVRPQKTNQFYTQFLKDGKPVDEVEADFFLVNVAHGQSKDQGLSILNGNYFPSANRQVIQKPTMIKEYLMKYKGQSKQTVFSNFQFLLYLSKVLDLHTVLAICEYIWNGQEISQHLVELIESI